MDTTKRFIPIQASLERILDTTSSNKISIQDGKVLYTIDGGFSFFDLSGIRYLKAPLVAVENENTRIKNLGSNKGNLSIVNTGPDGYKIYYTSTSGKVDLVAGGVSPDTRDTAGATNSTNKLFLVGSPNQGLYSQTYTNVNVFAQNGELTATVFNGSLAGNAATATTAETANLASVATKLGTTTVGSGVKPIYLNTGTATASSSTVGSASVPVYLNAGTFTATTGVATKTELTSGLALKVGLSGDENIAGNKNFTGTLYYGGEEVATLQDLTTVFKYMGSKATYADLPSTGNRIGDVWNVLDTGNNYAWSGTEWDNLAGVVDLSNYFTKAEISALLNAKENLANKVNSFTTGSATLYPTTNAVKTYVDAGLLLKENISNKKTTLTNSTTDYPSTSAVKTYVDTQITTINDSKVDNAPTDGKVYGQQYGDWTSLEDTAELRDALCFEGSWDPTSWTPRDVVDGGTI